MRYFSSHSVLVALSIGATAISLASAAGASNSVPRLQEGPPEASLEQRQQLAGLQILPAQGNLEWMAPQLSSALYMTVQGPIAHAQLFQTFDNPSNETVDAVYHFPLPVTAAVEGLQLRVGDRLLAGSLQDREQAAESYASTRKTLTKTGWLQWQRPHWVSLHIANIGPGETIEVSLRYQQEVSHDHGTYALAFPVTQAPSDSVPAEPSVLGSGAEDGPWLHAEVTFDAPHSVHNVRSSSHVLDELTESDGSTRVRLRYGPLIADRHFHVQWEQQSAQQQTPTFQEETFAGEHYALLEVSADATTSPWAKQITPTTGGQALEVSFVFDATASMRGEAMTQARHSLRLGLHHLAAEDTFNVVVFGDTTRSLFSEAQSVTPANLRMAEELIENLRAGGQQTLLSALQEAIKSSAPRDNRPRRVVLLTDGGSSNQDKALRFIEEHRLAQRVFTVGLGSAPNLNLVTQSARLSQGSFIYAATVNALDDALPALLNKLQPAPLNQLQVVFEGSPRAELFPDSLTALRAGDHRLVVAKLSSENHGASIRGLLSAGQVFQTAQAAVDSQPQPGLHRIWAQRKLQSAADESLRRNKPHSAERSGYLQSLAQKHGLLSRYTSWLVMDTEASVSKLGRTVSIPLAPAAGTPRAIPPQLPKEEEPTCLLDLHGK